MTKIKWGILGAANIAKTAVIPAILESENGKLYAIASRGGNKLEGFQHFNAQKYYDSYEKLLADPEVEAIYIPLPNGFHKEWCLKALRQKKHVLCEKPLALNASEVREMQETATQNGVILMEAFAYLHSPAIWKLKEVIQSGAIGWVKYIHSSFTFLMEGDSDVRLDPAIGGGVIYDLGCYTMSLARYLLNEEPIKVQVLPTSLNGVDTDVAFQALFERGVKMSSYVSFGAEYHTNGIIFGEKGRIEMNFRYNEGGELSFDVVTPAKKETIMVTARNNYTLEVEQLGRAIRLGEAPHIDLEFSLNNSKALDLLLEAVKKSILD